MVEKLKKFTYIAHQIITGEWMVKRYKNEELVDNSSLFQRHIMDGSPWWATSQIPGRFSYENKRPAIAFVIFLISITAFFVNLVLNVNEAGISNAVVYTILLAVVAAISLIYYMVAILKLEVDLRDKIPEFKSQAHALIILDSMQSNKLNVGALELWLDDALTLSPRVNNFFDIEQADEIWKLIKTNFDFSNPDHNIAYEMLFNKLRMFNTGYDKVCEDGSWTQDAWLYLMNYFAPKNPSIIRNYTHSLPSSLWMEFVKSNPNLGSHIPIHCFLQADEVTQDSFFTLVFPQFDQTQREVFGLLARKTDHWNSVDKLVPLLNSVML